MFYSCWELGCITLKNNCRNNYIGNILCSLCTKETDTQKYLFECEKLLSGSDCNHEDIFSNDNDVLLNKVATTAKKMIDTRKTPVGSTYVVIHHT